MAAGAFHSALSAGPAERFIERLPGDGFTKSPRTDEVIWSASLLCFPFGQHREECGDIGIDRVSLFCDFSWVISQSLVT